MRKKGSRGKWAAGLNDDQEKQKNVLEGNRPINTDVRRKENKKVGFRRILREGWTRVRQRRQQAVDELSEKKTRTGRLIEDRRKGRTVVASIENRAPAGEGKTTVTLPGGPGQIGRGKKKKRENTTFSKTDWRAGEEFGNYPDKSERVMNQETGKKKVEAGNAQ